ncbi:sigma-54-dependent transcriptional regulator [Thermodesulfobacteriota bacterium]
MANILIVDDDRAICKGIAAAMNRIGHDSTYTLTLKEGLEEACSGKYDVVFLDVRLPDGNGLNALPEIRRIPLSPEVIIITGEGDPDGAELAIKNDAWDYIEKPLSIDAMTLPLTRALQYRDEKKTREPPVVLKREGIVGNSQPIKASLDLVAQAACSKANVLITGETGTGKELFAWAIHNNCRDVNENFVVVDCAAIPETLVESALFGYEKGAFTGADKAQEGLIKQADGGTLFLDEVGELSMPLQKAFLRVLQERRFRPIGGKKEVESDFRLLSATNRDLEHAVKNGQFRKDLLYRLQTLTIDLPPLRERPDDIKDLVVHYMRKICETYGLGLKGLSPDVLKILSTHDWPGNVRELVNTIDRAIAAARSEDTLFSKHLPTHIRVQAARASISTEAHDTERSEKNDVSHKTFPSMKQFRESLLSEGEKKYLKDLMLLVKGDIKAACRVSGLGRARLYGLMKKYNVSRFE